MSDQAPSETSDATPERASDGLVQPPPVQMNARRITLFGTLVWLVAVVVQLPFWSWLGEHGHRITLWTSVAGFGLGLLGYSLMERHRRMGRTI